MQHFKRFLLTGSFALSFVPAVLACSCRPPGSVAQEVKESQAVFLGKVTNAKGFKFTFQVQRYWKGISQKTVTVVSGPDTCGYDFKKGNSYLVYASGSDEANDESLYTNICTRTKSIREAKADLKALGKGRTVK